jgi:hypothetical protein
MNLGLKTVRLIFGLIFFALTACGGDPSREDINATAQNTFEAPSLCTTCLNRRINSHSIMFTGMDFTTKDRLSAIASVSGAGMIRMDLAWVAVQPAFQEVFDWRRVDESVRAARKNNLEILALINGTPAWASSNPTDPAVGFYPPAADRWDEWETFMTAFADRYGPKGTNEIRHWEIWGEANDTGQWLGTPAEYARLYSIAYDAIKRSDPTAQVLMAGMNEWNQPDWIDAVLNDPAYPARNKIDIIDVHIRGSFARVRDLTNGWKEAFRIQGIQNKPIWVTEIGFPSSPIFQKQWNSDFVGVDEADGQQKQADYYNTVLPWLLTTGGIDKVFVTLRDIHAPETPWASEGIITSLSDEKNPSPKISFRTIRELSARFSGPSPSPTITTTTTSKPTTTTRRSRL